MTSWLGFQPTIDVEVRLEGEDERKSVEVRVDKEKKERCPVYLDGEGVNGQVVIRVREGKGVKHEGVKVEFVGSIELFYDRGNHFEFHTLSQELASPGELKATQTYDFSFKCREAV